MSAAAAVKAPWFGELLDWRRDDQAGEWWALYAGRAYRLRKLGREVTGGRPGWYLTRHPDDREHDGSQGGTRPPISSPIPGYQQDRVPPGIEDIQDADLAAPG